MKTKQKISTICYQNINYLKFKLDELYKSDDIDFYAFIRHKAESDETKDHNHLIIYPSHKINTKSLDDYLSEPVPGEKDLGTCGLWHTVGKDNVSDWLLYALHDNVYCKMKGYLDRVYTYNINDIITSSRDALNDLYFEALHSSKFYFDKHIRETILNSDDVLKAGQDLVINGYIPLSNSCSFHHFLQIVKGG